VITFKTRVFSVPKHIGKIAMKLTSKVRGKYDGELATNHQVRGPKTNNILYSR
jgi:hypothetical protein